MSEEIKDTEIITEENCEIQTTFNTDSIEEMNDNDTVVENLTDTETDDKESDL